MKKERIYTPMMNQYLDVKEANPDSIIFYRLGDFYEMFFEDAQIVSSELDLVLTGRSAGVEEKIPMCGVPHHAAKNYIQRLISKGYKVAIVEQLEDPATAKGLVERGVVKIVTPGTIMDENDEKNSYYLASLWDMKFKIAVALCDMSTGELQVLEIERTSAAIRKLVLGNSVKEIVIKEDFDKSLQTRLHEMKIATISHWNELISADKYSHLFTNLKNENYNESAQLLLSYLEETQKQSLNHLQAFIVVNENNFLKMDYSTKQNLESTQSLHERSGDMTLWSFMDKAKTAMGSRLLKKWIERPLIHIEEIELRNAAIKYLHDNFIARDELKESLSGIYDMERLIARVAYGSANPRDVLRLIKTLEEAPKVINIMSDASGYEYLKTVDTARELFAEISGAIVDNPPLSLKDGGVFVSGYRKDLDELRDISEHGEAQILAIEAKEKERTGINSLKVGYNRVFGYYIEVTKSNLDKVEDSFGFVRKQTLTNAERFITEELKNKEEEILHAKENSLRLEQQIYNELLDLMKQNLTVLYQLAESLAMIDALFALAEVSSHVGYVCPTFVDNHEIAIVEARHPILESKMKDTPYVSNSLMMDSKCDVEIITGPNMGGKSTYMRQSALIVIMAQMGCYVPAREAILPIFDQIFTRIGASDDIMSGQSTFMVEMNEANMALQHATKSSLILFDEIGRGTSTYDGMALAQAMMEYIAQNIGAKTLFSTHYHELTQMEEMYPNIKNVHVEVHEEDGHVTFLYRVEEGKADKSYGINVARLAKLPDSVLERASDLLDSFEVSETSNTVQMSMVALEKSDPRKDKIVDTIDAIDVNELTPMEALQILYDIKK